MKLQKHVNFDETSKTCDFSVKFQKHVNLVSVSYENTKTCEFLLLRRNLKTCEFFTCFCPLRKHVNFFHMF